MCLGLDLFGAKKAAKISAKATMDAANMQAKADREAVRGNTLTMQTQIAQERASDLAAELLNKPQKGANVILSPDEDAPEIDPETNRRKTVRSQFFNAASTGINI